MKVEIVDERGHLHYFPADTHRALVDVGLIWREGETWRMHSMTGDVGPWPELAICDFCSERPVTWDIDVDDFAILGDSVKGLTTFTSTNGWVACEACGLLVAARKSGELFFRALGTKQEREPAVAAALALLQAEFWRHYRGIKRYATPYQE